MLHTMAIRSQLTVLLLWLFFKERFHVKLILEKFINMFILYIMYLLISNIFFSPVKCKLPEEMVNEQCSKFDNILQILLLDLLNKRLNDITEKHSSIQLEANDIKIDMISELLLSEMRTIDKCIPIYRDINPKIVNAFYNRYFINEWKFRFLIGLVLYFKVKFSYVLKFISSKFSGSIQKRFFFGSIMVLFRLKNLSSKLSFSN